MPPPGVHGSISAYCSAKSEWSAYQYTYQDVAPLVHTRAITISLLALRAVELARAYQGESTIIIPDQTLVSLLEARRPYKGMSEKPYGKIQRLILSLVTPRMSFVFNKACHLVHCQHSWDRARQGLWLSHQLALMDEAAPTASARCDFVQDVQFHLGEVLDANLVDLSEAHWCWRGLGAQQLSILNSHRRSSTPAD